MRIKANLHDWFLVSTINSDDDSDSGNDIEISVSNEEIETHP